MFIKYLWIINLAGAYLIWAILSVIDIVKCFRANYNFYIVQDCGDWKDVIEGSFVEIKTYTMGFIYTIISMVLIGSFISFYLYFEGAR